MTTPSGFVFACGPFIESQAFDTYRNALHGNAGNYSFQRLATDPIGASSLTLTNLVTGSAVEIEDSTDGTSLYLGTATGSTLTAALNVYPAGSTRNTVRVKVRKGSASPYYQPYETLAALVVGAQSIYVSQIPDE